MLTQKMFDDIFAIGLEQDQALPRRTFHLLGTFAHAMAFAGCTCFHFTGSGNAKTLFGPAMGLEFGHLMSFG
jgi:hypothetical protein